MSTQTLISRTAWGARYPDGFRDRPLPIREWWLHHSVTIAPDLLPPFTDDDQAVRTLESIGQSRFKGGISYTFPVTPVGRIYQGHSMKRQGAHTREHNTVGAAFVLVGDYRTRAPSSAQELAIAQRMVIEHRAGRALTHQLNGGHRDADTDPKRPGVQSSTECPGNAAEARIPAINALAQGLWTSGYPSAVVVPVPPDQTLPGNWFLGEDGLAGLNTRKAIQRMLGLVPDGNWGLKTRMTLQRWAGVKADGSLGPISRKAIQRKVGHPQTGVWDWDQSTKPDSTTKALQAYYNRAVRNRRLPF